MGSCFSYDCLIVKDHNPAGAKYVLLAPCASLSQQRVEVIGIAKVVEKFVVIVLSVIYGRSMYHQYHKTTMHSNQYFQYPTSLPPFRTRIFSSFLPLAMSIYVCVNAVYPFQLAT